MGQAPAHRGVRVGRAVLFACLPLVVLVTALELVLWAAGVGDPDQQLALTRGFDPQARYIVADPDVPGGWRTQMFDAPADEVHIGPRDGRARVLLFGGSNARLFSADDLAAQLDAAAPGRRHEVINLGRPGYGSEREAILVAQALATLKPDVVVLYCGHNEFVEAGFAAELAQEWSRSWLMDLAAQAQRLRTVNLAVQLARRPARPEGRLPEPRGERAETFDLQFEQTLIFYDLYRSNLEAMCQQASAHGAGVLLSTVVGNLLTPPVVSRHRRELSRDESREFNTLCAQCRKLVPERLLLGIIRTGPDKPKINLHWVDWGEHLLAGDDGRRPTPPGQPVPVLRPLLPPLDGGALWSDPSGWSPPVRELLTTVSAFHARELSPEERQAVEQAVELAHRALAISPEHALTVFELGLYQYLAGDTAEAVASLRRAATLDCSPNHGNDLTNAIVRGVAAAHPEVVLVDADELFAQRSPDRLVGYECLLDSCHLQRGARHQLMADFVPGILELLAKRGR